jgi:hypothetical protein
VPAERCDEVWAGVDGTLTLTSKFRTATEVAPEELRTRYADACAHSREVVARTASLDELSVGTSSRTGSRWDLRWVLLHMVGETAWHADLLRESIDGTTGA